jgi:hypothetical protein
MAHSIVVQEGNIKPNERSIKLSSQWCVVFHGKIYNEKFLSYLLNNLEKIRETNREIGLVVATYQDKFMPILFDEGKRLNFEVVEVLDAGPLPSPLPKSLAQQIATISSGINKAEELGFKYVVKVRVDQFANINKIVEIANKLFSKYPPLNSFLETRIWSTSYNTYRYRLLGISDMLMFGEIQTMKKYWPRWDNEDIVEFCSASKNQLARKQLYNFSIPESLLAFKFISDLEINGQSLEDTNNYFWTHLGGVVNSTAIAHSWGKSFPWVASNFHSLNWFGNLFGPELAELTFEDWLMEYQ